ncbi:hypothetical protein WDJ50_02455 [Deinococcus sp. VB142]|uniref:DUF2188 domain-containing protein n=1 Tax=Deinococcus sp. VB142 TaxID=3112952 RepID=A0AAU6Q315_9DEIO
MSIFATITDLSSGEVIERLGPFESATEGRTACAKAAGAVLMWQRAGYSWEAKEGGRVYQVPRDTVLEPEQE